MLHGSQDFHICWLVRLKCSPLTDSLMLDYGRAYWDFKEHSVQILFGLSSDLALVILSQISYPYPGPYLFISLNYQYKWQWSLRFETLKSEIPLWWDQALPASKCVTVVTWHLRTSVPVCWKWCLSQRSVVKWTSVFTVQWLAHADSS